MLDSLNSQWHTIPKWRKALYAVGLPVGAIVAIALFVV